MKILKTRSSKPEDLGDGQTLLKAESNTPLVLQDLSPAEKLAYEEKKIGLHNMYTRKTGKIDQPLWDVDTSESAEGYFDSRGNFIMGSTAIKKVRNPMPFWLIKGEGVELHGPFSNYEMHVKDKNGELEGKSIKLESNKYFIVFDELKKSFTNPFEKNLDLSDFFREHERRESQKIKKSDDFYDEDLKIEESTKPKVNIPENRELTEKEIKDVLLRCTKCIKFLERRKATVDLVTIERKVRGLSKAKALKALDKLTGMNKLDNADFVDLLIKESKLKIFKDVDKDGFMIK
ncbi:hypothetical protein TCON_1269 [Astathelohania contejeani]|uniref:Uncharacterized protein n=1 Tax=Astathelohania contejeani TaxID=164912 RepID=A0ABQ7HZC7_9MICR|nr:hypothetical protein TCON_1269 [Thelohania contejeani]